MNVSEPVFFNLKADIPLSKPGIDQLLMVHSSEIQSKKKDIQSLIERLFKTSIESIHFLENKGTLHYLFDIKLSNGSSYLIKTSKNASPYKAFHFYHDAWIKKQLTNSNCSIPTVIDIDCSRQHYNFDYCIVEKIEGNSLNDLKGQNDYHHCLSQVGEKLAQIHAIKTNKTGLINSELLYKTAQCEGRQSSWKEYLITNLENHLHYCVEQSIFDKTLQSEILEIFNYYHYLFDMKESSLLHGDLNDFNILFKDTFFFLDWEDALSGDPVFDIAMWGTFVNHHENLNHFLSGYQTIKNLSKDFLLRYWIYYLRIILMKTVVRYKFNYYKTDKIPAITRIMLPLNQLKEKNF